MKQKAPPDLTDGALIFNSTSQNPILSTPHFVLQIYPNLRPLAFRWQVKLNQSIVWPICFLFQKQSDFRVSFPPVSIIPYLNHRVFLYLPVEFPHPFCLF